MATLSLPSPTEATPLACHAAATVRKPVVGIILGAVLLFGGMGLLILQMLMPATLERGLGEAKVALEATASRVVTEVAPTSYPTVTLGPLGGMKEMDWCDGRFIEMESYRISGVLPVYAGHNKCGADIILGWNIGDHVKIAGSDIIYEVVEERHTKKWDNIASLRGMKGELILQTCFWGQNKMRFLSLAPVDVDVTEHVG